MNSNWRGIYMENSAGCKLTDNIVNSNRWYGIHLYNSDSNLLHENTVDFNTGEWDSTGVYLSESEGNELTKNEANSNWNGMILWHSGNAKIYENVVTLNNRGGISLQYSGNSSVNDNLAGSNDNGISLDNSDYVNILRNFIKLII